MHFSADRPRPALRAVTTGICCAAVTASVMAPVDAGAVPRSAAQTPAPRIEAPLGTVFLPNLDDDSRRCTLRPGDLDRLDVALDERLAACHDAADEMVNGPEDAKDLTPLLVPPTAVGEDAVGRLAVPAAQRPYVRIFVREGDRYTPLGADGALSARDLRRGVRLAVEGRDIVRDRTRWDGRVLVTLTVTDRGRTGSTRLGMSVAPVLLQHDLQRARHVFAAAPGKGPGQPVEVPTATRVPGGWKEFAGSLRAATRAVGLPDRELNFQPGGPQWWKDIWRQDIAEPAYATRPGPGGPQTMRILLRSPNYWKSPDGTGASLRRAGRLLFKDLRGPGVGVVQQYTTDRPDNVDELLNFTGNIESLPPYRGYPKGRVVYGSSADRRPDPSFVRMLRDQREQPPVVIDTSWLLVGHADETVHVVRADNARGWTLAVSDPRLAIGLLKKVQEAGEGGQRLFADTDAEDKPTVDEFLRYDAARGDNEDAARRIDEQVRVLLRATGLKPTELVRLPVLYFRVTDTPGAEGRHIAFSPALANGLSLTAEDFAAPAPHGPRLAGRDLFRAEAERRLTANGVRVHWVENFSWSHLGGGEVHCATNALRDIGR
ncbi:protein-arginine deiminase family protein [Streptomyces sp. ML-6]|uniref:protein-arginine deiminase family protein n=1 Tax=Streptomyces sp. ML-6 TaxID=2982693 RepID=UPI0024C0A078|nr:protein-arginine deiminase family protein [Streptomyces sp. ML-6]MDK0517826.1 protein-arginine deiminase domain-containing protein [Streptomyces sp. ML-6]